MSSMARDVAVELGGADLAERFFDEICDAYDEVFSAPPYHWHEDESLLHQARLESLLSEQSFGIALARADEVLVGFAHGLTIRADSKRWDSIIEPLPEEMVTEWPGRTFLLVDYCVRTPWRGKGIGRKLHDTLLRSRREERATLTVQPAALETKR